jgi:hypothetical protein
MNFKAGLVAWHSMKGPSRKSGVYDDRLVSCLGFFLIFTYTCRHHLLWNLGNIYQQRGVLG